MRSRTGLFVLTTALVAAGCGREAERLNQELARQTAAVEAVRAEADEAALVQEMEHGIELARIADLAQLLRDELAGYHADGGPDGPADRCRARAERLILATTNKDLLLATEVGARLYVEVRGQIAAWLAEVGLTARAREIAADALATAQARLLEAPRSRRLAAAIGDAHIAVARVEVAAGEPAVAIEHYERGIASLLASDKGRGDGTGSSEFQGDGTGGGGGKGRGKGKNRDQSIALKRHVLRVYEELCDLQHAQADYANELLTINEARLTAGNLCQVMRNSDGVGYQLTRMGFAALIDRLGDVSDLAEDKKTGLSAEKLAHQILRELVDEAPDERVLREHTVEQAAEVAQAMAEIAADDPAFAKEAAAELLTLGDDTLSEIEALRADGPDGARWSAFEAELAAGVARVLVAAGEDASAWWDRVIASAEALRADGRWTDSIAALEAAARAARE